MKITKPCICCAHKDICKHVNLMNEVAEFFENSEDVKETDEIDFIRSIAIGCKYWESDKKGGMNNG